MDEDNEKTIEELHEEEPENDVPEVGELDVKDQQDAGVEPEKDGDTEIKDTDIKTELDNEEHCKAGSALFTNLQQKSEIKAKKRYKLKPCNYK